jgi:hypothetical protein
VREGEGELRAPVKGRVSLNLRFGLHTEEQAWEDIDQHWA